MNLNGVAQGGPCAMHLERGDVTWHYITGGQRGANHRLLAGAVGRLCVQGIRLILCFSDTDFTVDKELGTRALC